MGKMQNKAFPELVTVKTLSERKQDFQQIDAKTIFPACQQQL
jgi:hypothetical protein